MIRLPVIRIAIIGAGPAGLAASECLSKDGCSVTVYDHMASAGRKFLLAGRGGLNLTHSEDLAQFLTRYAAAAPWMANALHVFPPRSLQSWCEGLGQHVFTGSSGRIFPAASKAAPLLRAWLRRLGEMEVAFRLRCRWTGWSRSGQLRFATPEGELLTDADAVLLAMGGASWPRMGSDGGWVPILQEHGVRVSALRASNCGLSIPWSPMFRDRFEGQPLKRVALTVGGQTAGGEAVVTRAGLEGGAVYALSAAVRAALDADGVAALQVDLLPDLSMSALAARTDGARRGRSLSNFLRQAAGLAPVGIGLVQEALRAGAPAQTLNALIKAVPLTIGGLQPIERAISSAGGIVLDELDDGLMLRRLPGVFAAGEMLDWDAPTGGYLLQGCFSTGVLAAHGIRSWLADRGTAAAPLLSGLSSDAENAGTALKAR